PITYSSSVHCSRDPLALHSFPTRRSSDLRRRRQPGTGVVLRSGVGVRRREVGAHRAIDILSLGQQRELHFAARVLRESWGSERADRKSTRLNSSHVEISYAVFCLKKKT